MPGRGIQIQVDDVPAPGRYCPSRHRLPRPAAPEGAGDYFTVEVFGGDRLEQLIQGVARLPDENAPLTGHHLGRGAFLEPELPGQGGGYPDRQAVSPLSDLRAH